MKLSEEDILLIEKYFEGTFSDEESALFREKLIASESFAEQVKLQETMLTVIKIEEDSDLREQLKNKAKSFQIPLPKKQFNWYPGVAAALLIILSVTFFFPSYESLYKNSFNPLLSQPITRGKVISDRDYKCAMEAYSVGNYEEANNFFNKVADPDLRYEANLYKGNCQLELGNTEKAIAELTEAKKSGSEWVLENANWYLALAFIKMHDKSNAIEILENIEQKRGPYKNKATDLLKQLKWSFY